MYDIEEIGKELIRISEMIEDTIEQLADMSEILKENTRQFSELVNDIREYEAEEEAIISELDTETMKEVIEYLMTLDIPTEGFCRCRDNLEERYSILTCGDNDGFLEYKSIQDFGLDVYLKDISDVKEYEFSITDKLSIVALKRIRKQVKRTKTDNQEQRELQRKLLRKIRCFKYDIFTSNIRLEKQGVECRFRIDSLQEPASIDDKSLEGIYYNQGIQQISGMFSMKIDEKNYSDILHALFNMLYLELCLSYLSPESIDEYVEICNNLSTKHQNTFGEFCRKRLLEIKKN